ncbi:MAG: hypothetical protein BWY39_00952 [Spirochaetes bacterium ADurb.Bin269]|nr:MAG: hypothetical protein BWY39_00952 [Spirochaetes bacterium ADurb.Bin269]
MLSAPTSPAPIGSVTVAKITGLSLMTFAAATAVGVAIATTASTPSALNFVAICIAVFTSPFAFCPSKDALRPRAASSSLTPCSIASRAGWATILEIPIRNVWAASAPAAASFLAQPVAAIAANRADAHSAAQTSVPETLIFFFMIFSCESYKLLLLLIVTTLLYLRIETLSMAEEGKVLKLFVRQPGKSRQYMS